MHPAENAYLPLHLFLTPTLILPCADIASLHSHFCQKHSIRIPNKHWPPHYEMPKPSTVLNKWVKVDTLFIFKTSSIDPPQNFIRFSVYRIHPHGVNFHPSFQCATCLTTQNNTTIISQNYFQTQTPTNFTIYTPNLLEICLWVIPRLGFNNVAEMVYKLKLPTILLVNFLHYIIKKTHKKQIESIWELKFVS